MEEFLRKDIPVPERRMSQGEAQGGMAAIGGLTFERARKTLLSFPKFIFDEHDT